MSILSSLHHQSVFKRVCRGCPLNFAASQVSDACYKVSCARKGSIHRSGIPTGSRTQLSFDVYASVSHDSQRVLTSVVIRSIEVNISICRSAVSSSDFSVAHFYPPVSIFRLKRSLATCSFHSYVSGCCKRKVRGADADSV